MFADISEELVSKELAARFQAALNEMAGAGGVVATVMSADGTWSGAAGKADGVRDISIDDQFAIADVGKPIAAAQMMQLVEAGELSLDDPAGENSSRPTSTSTPTGRPSAICSASAAASPTSTTSFRGACRQ